MSYTFRKGAHERSNTWKKLQKGLATLLAKTLQRNHRAPRNHESATGPKFGLYVAASRRKYLNGAERQRFMSAAQNLPVHKRLFCLILTWSGVRISEALAISPAAFDLDARTVSIETLKRRRRGIVRQIPLPSDVLRQLDEAFDIRASQLSPEDANQRLWPWTRSTGWRCVKQVMQTAGIVGSAAMPKGLRHGFGVAAFAAVPPHLVQRWLGHASLRSTAIYGDVSGPEERQLAERLWQLEL